MAPQAMMAPQKPAVRQFIKEANWIPNEFEKKSSEYEPLTPQLTISIKLKMSQLELLTQRSVRDGLTNKKSYKTCENEDALQKHMFSQKVNRIKSSQIKANQIE